MNTPICDFVRGYAEKRPVRFHMPGHKGKGDSIGFGFHELDITEIGGADVLYDSNGVIRESEENAAQIFGSARTVYSTEGSSLCIRAMIYLAVMHAKMKGQSLRIAAGRNAHRVFLETAALLNVDVSWLGTGDELLRCRVTQDELECMFQDRETAPTAVYLTSPDYLGHCTDLRSIAEVCRKNGALLLVDNAHGAYLKFLEESRHPLDCGADLCCDSAHKTLPVLTGGAYLHASYGCPGELLTMMERTMALFASTSPSWLILQSLDGMNARLGEDYPVRIRETAKLLQKTKQRLKTAGWELTGDEALKLTLRPKKRGYTGTELGDCLKEKEIVCEFADPDDLVLMVTPEIGEAELALLEAALQELPAREPILAQPPQPCTVKQVLSPHEVLFRPFERIPTENSLGKILASPSVSCPPAVPIVICGERIDEQALALFQYYGIEYCDVVKQPESPA